MTAPMPIESNFPDAQGQKITNSTQGRFNLYDYAQYSASIAGPAAAETVAYKQGYGSRSASIVGAAVNATAGGGMGTYAGGAMAPGVYSGGQAAYSPFMGQGGLGVGRQVAPPIDPSLPNPLVPQQGGDLTQAVAQSTVGTEATLASMITIQQKLSTLNIAYTGLSQAMAARDGMLSGILRNLRT